MSRLSDAVAISVRQARPEYLWAGHTVFDVVLDGDHTGGELALLDQRGTSGDATPLHVHRSEAEIIYVLSGSLRAWTGDDAHDLEEGAAIYLPPGSPHAFRVESQNARFLTLTTPAGFAAFVREAGVAVDEVPTRWDFDLGRIMDAAPRHGIDIVGPPPT